MSPTPTGYNSFTGTRYNMNPAQFGTQDDANRYLQLLSQQLGPGASVADTQFDAAGPFSLDQPYLHLRPSTAPYGGLNVGMLADLEAKYGTDPGSQFQQVVGNDMAYMGRDDPSMRAEPRADPNNADVAAYWGRGAPVSGNVRGSNVEYNPGATNIPLYSPRPARPGPSASTSQTNPTATLTEEQSRAINPNWDSDMENARRSGARRRLTQGVGGQSDISTLYPPGSAMEMDARILPDGTTVGRNDPRYWTGRNPYPNAPSPSGGFPGGRDPLSPLPVASAQARQNAAPGSATISGERGIPSMSGAVNRMYPGGPPMQYAQGRNAPRYPTRRYGDMSGGDRMAGLHYSNPRPTPRPRYSSY